MILNFDEDFDPDENDSDSEDSMPVDKYGEPLENEDGELMIEFDPEKEYTEREAMQLAIYAQGQRDTLASFKQVRTQINDSEKGRNFFQPTRYKHPVRGRSRSREAFASPDGSASGVISL